MESARIVSVVGFKDSGKTRVVEALVAELTKRGYNVGSLKHTSEDVLLDTPGKDTWRHKKAGSKATAILHDKASALFYERPMSFNEALSKLGDLDFVVTEGFKSLETVAKIVVPRVQSEVENLSNGLEIVIVKLDNRNIHDFEKVPTLSLQEIEKITDNVMEKAFPLLPGLNCNECGYENCLEFGKALLSKETNLKRCIGFIPNFNLIVNGKKVVLRGFARKVTENVVLGLLDSFKGIDNPTTVEFNFQVDRNG